MEASKPTIRIESVELYEEETDVYDIEVEDDHSFFVGGVVLHNCLVCAGADGLQWDMDFKPIGHHIAFQNTPVHWNCRGVISVRTKLFGDIAGARATAGGPFVGDFDDFLKSKGPEFQDKMFGPGRAQLWRDGKITRANLLDMRGKELTLDQLKNLTQKPVVSIIKMTAPASKDIVAALKGIGGEAGLYASNAASKIGQNKSSGFIINRGENPIAAVKYSIVKDSADIDLLGGWKGGGTEAIAAVSRASFEAGKGGAISLMPLRNNATVNFYIKAGFDMKPDGSGKFWLSPEMAKKMGYIK